MPRIYETLARKIQARANCHTSGNAEWFERHTEDIRAIVREKFPSGSGFDNGTSIDLDASTAEKLVFTGSFHHMDDVGSYSHWTDHRVTVRPSLAFGCVVSVTGAGGRDHKNYVSEVFHNALDELIVD